LVTKKLKTNNGIMNLTTRTVTEAMHFLQLSAAIPLIIIAIKHGTQLSFYHNLEARDVWVDYI
jgi:hypothetical protein